MEESGHRKDILFFVYNVDSDIFSELKDYFHKAVSPSPYDCPLRALTYGSTGMKREWKKFLMGLDFRVEFLHRDEMSKKYPAVAVPLPAVFKSSNHSLNLVLNAGEIGSCRDLEDLMDLLTYKLKHVGVMLNVH
ncbi:hypothetical protein [Methanogenium organophilum]|uniref:Uncharacterized protein n=1 Tax=Methanogenium organophilum TaxID=2199 RepID=A0A9X9T781_METOG|nr:hypothetical protein [Methanogenium organophilum]WAI00161.1 hypothetical protein OU421_06875 [Methanogenium organophilum]